MQELADRFDQSEFLPEVLGLESLLLKAANGDNYESELESVLNGCFASDLKLLGETHFGQTFQPTPAIVDHTPDSKFVDSILGV